MSKNVPHVDTVDPQYEFDLPQYYDFDQLNDSPGNADEWFAKRAIALRTNPDATGINEDTTDVALIIDDFDQGNTIATEEEWLQEQKNEVADSDDTTNRFDGPHQSSSLQPPEHHETSSIVAVPVVHADVTELATIPVITVTDVTNTEKELDNDVTSPFGCLSNCVNVVSSVPDGNVENVDNCSDLITFDEDEESSDKDTIIIDKPVRMRSISGPCDLISDNVVASDENINYLEYCQSLTVSFKQHQFVTLETDQSNDVSTCVVDMSNAAARQPRSKDTKSSDEPFGKVNKAFQLRRRSAERKRHYSGGDCSINNTSHVGSSSCSHDENKLQQPHYAQRLGARCNHHPQHANYKMPLATPFEVRSTAFDFQKHLRSNRMKQPVFNAPNKLKQQQHKPMKAVTKGIVPLKRLYKTTVPRSPNFAVEERLKKRRSQNQ